MKNFRIQFAALLTVTGLLVTAPAMAGGPIAVCQSGVPYLWADGGTGITFNPDQGNLGPVPGAAAIALVGSAFQAWEDIPSASMTYMEGDPLPFDVDVNNFNPYLNPVAPDGLSAVVFDDTGEIFDLLFGVGTGVLGFAGPEWVNTIDCTIDEGLSFLNGPSFGDATAALDVMVHEFGHWTNFAHTVVNGQIYLGSVGGDSTGPTPNDTFGPPVNPFSDVVETMYPFYYGPGIGSATPAADDIAIASRMYPDANYASNTGAISGTIFFGSSKVTGVNVIARNLADPFFDAVSAISSDFTDAIDQADPNVGVYTITGLTPGADYAVYVDEVLAGGFSTTLASPLPGPEEFYNGANESFDPGIDDPSLFVPVTVAAGSPNTGIDIYFNQPQEGDPLAVGDDGAVELPLPFDFCLYGQAFDTVFVNANGHLTFGAPDPDFSPSAQEFRDGPPRVAAAWRDLNPTTGGSVFFGQDDDSFTVTWEDVPEWLATGSNTFSITLNENSKACVEDDDSASDDRSSDDHSSDDRSDGRSDDGSADVVIRYESLQLLDGIAGVTGGLAVTSGEEAEVDLSELSRGGHKSVKAKDKPAVFEDFADGDNDLNGLTIRFSKVGKGLKDRFEKNNSLKKARPVRAPFSTRDTRRAYTAIDPAANDIDFFRFFAEEGKYLIADVARGQLDSVLGLYYCPDSGGGRLVKCDPDTAILIAANDDANGLLSRIEGTLPVTGTYALAVTFCCDYDFDGVDPGQGLPFDLGRYVLDIALLDGIPLTLGDDSTVELSGFGFLFPFDEMDYSSIFVNSNGNITFGAGDPFGYIPSIPAFEGGSPRVAPLWQDLDATGALVLAETDFATELKITFVDVPEFGGFGANNFSVTLYSSGDVQYDYGSVTAATGIVGAAQGFGAPSTAIDFSGNGGLGSVAESSVEEFTGASPYDFSDGQIVYITPDPN